MYTEWIRRYLEVLLHHLLQSYTPLIVKSLSKNNKTGRFHPAYLTGKMLKSVDHFHLFMSFIHIIISLCKECTLNLSFYLYVTYNQLRISCEVIHFVNLFFYSWISLTRWDIVLIHRNSVINSHFSRQGFTIPLEKRLAADGRGLQTVHINENFAKLAESLYIADRKVG